MPNLETPDELADEIADKLYVYGSHSDIVSVDCPKDCRICFVMDLTERIRQSVRNEKRLHATIEEDWMIRWEYRHTELTVKSTDAGKVERFLNQQGDEGWEVCFVTRDFSSVPAGTMVVGDKVAGAIVNVEQRVTVWGFILKRSKPERYGD